MTMSATRRVLCAVLTSVVVAAALPDGDWQTVGRMPWVGADYLTSPLGRQDFALAPWIGADPDRGLMLLGGFSADAQGNTAPGRVWNDVYTSSNGVRWNQPLPVRWAARSKHHAVLVGSVVLLFGGWDPTPTTTPTYYSDTWYCSDGYSWHRTGTIAGWAGRVDAAATAVTTVGATQQSALLVGGLTASGAMLADVWISAPNSLGATWTQALTHNQGLALFGARSGAAATTVAGVPYLMGGLNQAGEPLNDVWKGSATGTVWTQVVAHDPLRVGGFTPRAFFSVASADTVTRLVTSFLTSDNGATPGWPAADLSSLFVTGGSHNESVYFGDAYASSTSAAVMQPNAAAASEVGASFSPLLNRNGTGQVLWPRRGHASIVYCGYLYVIGGRSLTPNPDNSPDRHSTPSMTPTWQSFDQDIVRRFVGDDRTHAPCPAGTSGCDASQSAGQQGWCQPCTTGHYTPYAGLASCLACRPGTYAAQAGATACTPCPPGTTSSPGMSYCYSNSGGGGGSSSSSSKRHKLSGGAIAGIVIGSLVVLLFVCCAVRACKRQRAELTVRSLSSSHSTASSLSSPSASIAPLNGSGWQPPHAAYSVVPGINTPAGAHVVVLNAQPPGGAKAHHVSTDAIPVALPVTMQRATVIPAPSAPNGVNTVAVGGAPASSSSVTPVPGATVVVVTTPRNGGPPAYPQLTYGAAVTGETDATPVVVTSGYTQFK